MQWADLQPGFILSCLKRSGMLRGLMSWSPKTVIPSVTKGGKTARSPAGSVLVEPKVDFMMFQSQQVVQVLTDLLRRVGARWNFLMTGSRNVSFPLIVLQIVLWFLNRSPSFQAASLQRADPSQSVFTVVDVKMIRPPLQIRVSVKMYRFSAVCNEHTQQKQLK